VQALPCRNLCFLRMLEVVKVKDMCGICGQFNYRHGARVDLDDVTKMTQSLAHRGPDDEGYFLCGSVGLGFRRLSIIDLGGGRQPMSDVDGSIQVVFNGEIYNFKELKAELEALGHRFQTNSDTEVIVYGYKQWGDRVFDRLNGMFGLAIWNTVKRRLILARDRMGIKLVYYSIKDGRLVFGSEIRPIMAALKQKTAVDPTGLKLFLTHRYTPSPFTIFEGIQKLAPGTKLVVDYMGEPKIERWWNYSPTPFDPPPKPQDAAEELLSLYRSAVRRQLVSDVPVGLLLSGGLDSALLLALMEEVGHDWNTYTVGYGKSFGDDELHQALRTAGCFGARNTPVQIDRSAFEASLDGVISALEEPVATSSIVPMYHVCQRARQDVKVALMGQGPDELFGGYTRHIGVAYGGYWRRTPEPMRRLVGVLPRFLPRSESIRRGLYALGPGGRMERYRRVLSVMPDRQVGELLKKEMKELSTPRGSLGCWNDLEPLMGDTDELGGLQFLEIRSTLPDELLMYADKLSMSHGLEVRVPYLDQEIVQYVERLPANLKVRYGIRKYLHRRVARSFLPKELLLRKKRGFASNVVDGWFRDSLAGITDELLRDHQSHIYRYLEADAVKNLLDDHKAGRADNHKALFSLVVLERLLQRHFTS
jgi:asparagine synthase (glutamine-hydrolysing)